MLKNRFLEPAPKGGIQGVLDNMMNLYFTSNLTVHELQTLRSIDLNAYNEEKTYSLTLKSNIYVKSSILCHLLLCIKQQLLYNKATKI